MFALRMIQLIETHAAKLSEELLYRLERSENCRELTRRVPPEELRMRTHEIYRNLSQWLLEKTQAEIEERYVGLGLRRAAQGVPFSELLYAFSMTKECLWEHLEQDALLEDPLELIGNLNLLHAVGRFFDRAAHAAAMGYETARQQHEHVSARAS
ncbi:MAG TPA: hypothetical protein VF133_14025 [Terriglobales bacterium]